MARTQTPQVGRKSVAKHRWKLIVTFPELKAVNAQVEAEGYGGTIRVALQRGIANALHGRRRAIITQVNITAVRVHPYNPAPA